MADLRTPPPIPTPVDRGGTGQTSYTNGELLVGQTIGNTLAKAAMSGDITMDKDGVATIGALKVATGMVQDDAVTPAKVALFNYQTDNSDSIASVTNGNLKIQIGWGQKLGTGASSMSETVTFPAAYTTVLGVICQIQGAKATTSATSVTDLTAAAAGTSGINCDASAITTSQFTMTMARATGSFSGTTYYGYSWIAWGL